MFKPQVEGSTPTESDMVRARVLRRDAVTDLALLQVSLVPPGVKRLARGTVEAMQVGADVHAIGHPTGMTWTYTRGIISQIRRDYSWSVKGMGDYRATLVQTPTPINPGNSGGPLLDDKMAIIGINTFVSEGEGLNFAISADDVKAFLARTADRLPDKPAAKTCDKAATLEEWREDKPKGTSYLIDTDCDGAGDVVMTVPDKKSEPIAWTSDQDGDGKIDTIILDANRDGDFDSALYDTDADGELDLRGEFRGGEVTPWRLERLSR